MEDLMKLIVTLKRHLGNQDQVQVTFIEVSFVPQYFGKAEIIHVFFSLFVHSSIAHCSDHYFPMIVRKKITKREIENDYIGNLLHTLLLGK